MASKLSSNHQVVILSHNEEKLKQVSQELNCDFVMADVTDYSLLEEAVKQVIEKYHRIDILINNAGIWTEGKLEETDPQQIEEVIRVNTLGTIFLSKLIIPVMKSQKGGRIINIISQDGLHAKKEHAVYSASKWAITGFTQCLQMDLSGQNISVTGIYPGLMKTALFQKQGVPRDLSHALELTEVANLIEYVINLSPDTLITDIGIKNIINPTNMDDNTSVPQIGLDINPDMITPQIGSPSLTPPTPTTDVPATPLPGVIDITPGASDQPQGTGHLADLIPQPITTPAPVAQITPDVPVTPPVILSVAEGSPSTIITPPTSPLAEDPDLVKLA
ncbi:MAG: KR domain protein [Candidatus Collierbacteria bacterium GW2011_GWB1_45_35]|uniref:KR domain protein n=2 Tax=Candidatus Collieribacteriota TaxID=1752725 RepID=A0A0G1NQ90_9BACT|nr:MAG: KR domain protein [Microgenomates group bacterium GW2011_GWC1_44_23]KKT86364.1 MAG: KR domain protein [Candidatus Collierbacteria bacterium GW2011_GWA2_44_99]KKT95770.1 MAG: KR domain protein [Candidatus Collierbacteria bacterium GW2011_GWA1_45_15]KKU00286.1 MAG: KR domain protein [Candidatus Collierbacteria bacterium GW2011_GWB2_45_17]KKU05487.1 MAG: KR domain protein [Candidatus Collierbacteria bacterium GW2011_GWB1_45_35]KKU08716.1 MAG: KR domain protein [Candidatus Collierbacteria 